MSNGTGFNGPQKRKKKSKSRKGLAKAFACSEPGCDKSFTRLEHLGRHQLNHAPKQIFACTWPGCTKVFVRKDLRTRHLDRHSRKNGKEVNQNNLPSLEISLNGEGKVSSGYEARQNNDSPVSDSSTAPMDDAAIMQMRMGKEPALQLPVSEFETEKFSSNPSAGALSLTSQTVEPDFQPFPAEFGTRSESQTPLALDKFMESSFPDNQGSVNLMGTSMDESSSTDLIDWLFSDAMLAGNRDFYAPNDFSSFLVSPMIDISQLSSPPQFSQSKIMSDSKRDELISLVPGLESEPDFSLDTIRICMELYWEKFHFQFPILHRRSFEVDRTPAPLILCMILIGGSYDAGARKITDRIAEPLRWVIFGSPDFHPVTKAWILQSLLLLEIYEKMLSTRKLHERAHIHHGATLQLIRRGSTLHDSSATTIPGDGDDSTWKRWVEAESIKRAIFVAFILDVTHSVIFGHSILMYAHEMRLSLPCDDTIWEATDNQRKPLMSKPPLPFLVALKRILNQQTVEVDNLGRHVLMCGVMSLAIQMSHQALQVSSIGWGSFRDTWKSTLARAYDFWLADYEPQRRQKLLSTVISDTVSVASSSNAENDMGPMFVLLYHMSQLSMHVARYDLRVFCGDKRVLGRSTVERDFEASKRHMYEWAHSQSGSIAAFHSIKALYKIMVLGDESTRIFQINPPIEATSSCGYHVAKDIYVHRASMLVHCMLVYWAYAYCRCGPESEIIAGGLPSANVLTSDEDLIAAAESGRIFLERLHLRTSKPSDLDSLERKHLTVDLLRWIIWSLRGCEWELLGEMIVILERCVQRSLGKEFDGNCSE
ncbi:fungal-specific transcription factor domain-containing protein [Myxozyma melibiosi]|uniref:Fungal-specific transcription factor domain-containing protein n=1 Tax=Myxozyma melibiosi TaxID=54550 RepID=A0ABR1EZ61_9ASCO